MSLQTKYRDSIIAKQGRSQWWRGAQFPGLRITMGAAKSPTMSQALPSIDYICFRKTSGSNMGR